MQINLRARNFIESKDYGVLFGEQEQKPGPIVNNEGKVLGQHRGIIHYTIGQRKGLGLGGTADPLYVIRLDACANTVVVGAYSELFACQLVAKDLNWIGIPTAPSHPLRVQAKIRQQHKESPAVIQVVPGTDTVEAIFAEPQMSITPGQIVVFYADDLVLGSGTISQ